MKNESFAKEILQDYKKANKRLFIIILVVLTMWFATIGYLVYVLNDIGVETSTTTESYEIEQSTDGEGNNNFIRGNDNGVK